MTQGKDPDNVRLSMPSSRDIRHCLYIQGDSWELFQCSSADKSTRDCHWLRDTANLDHKVLEHMGSQLALAQSVFLWHER